MKPFLVAVLLLHSIGIFAQIKNNGFETPRDTNAMMPNNWGVVPREGFTALLDNETIQEGKTSLRIQNNGNFTTQFMPFSQVVDLDTSTEKRLTIDAFIKTKDVTGNVALWCQIWDKDDKQIGFASSQIQNIFISGTNEWKQYSLPLTLVPGAKSLLIGGYLQGNGTAWFDGFTLEKIKMADTPPTKEIRNYINHLVKVVKKASVYKDSLDWKIMDKEIAGLLRGMSTPQDMKELSNYLLNKLRVAGDNHSLIYTKTEVDKAAQQNTDSRQPSGKLLDNRIGYVNVPGFSSTNDTAQVHWATLIQNIIKKLDTENSITGWVVDLRENTGGNMYPMIAGLGPLIGGGNLGHFITSDGRSKYAWFYKDGASGAGKSALVKVKDYYSLKNNDSKIAVLIGPMTSSSGEMTTVSFIGKPNAKLFGQPSGGYTTGNQGFKLKDGSELYLAASYISDRNHKKYLRKIEPDVWVSDKDSVIQKASDWLLEK
jgi:hypothetical protein